MGTIEDNLTAARAL